jgi:hypothetical protein
MAEEGKYVFCIIEAAPQPILGADGVRTITYRDLAAVVRDSPLALAKPTREDLVGHLRVVEQVMGSNTVIPVEFGTVAASEQEVQENLLAPRYEQLQALLAYLRGKVELGLKVLWRDIQAVFAEIVAEHESIRVLREWIDAHREAHTRQQRIEIGQMVAEALEAKKRREGEEILEALAPLAAEARAGQVLGEKMILNAAFLVEIQREPEFDQGVSHLAEERGQRLLFKYVGPVPPFNFVALQEIQMEGQ